MRKKLTRLICLAIVIILCVGIICACNNDNNRKSTEYFDAIILDRANVLMKSDFLEGVPSHQEFGEDTVKILYY